LAQLRNAADRPVGDPGVHQRGNNVATRTLHFGALILLLSVAPGSAADRFDGNWAGLMRCGGCENCAGTLERHVRINIEKSRFEIVPDLTYIGEGAVDGRGDMRIRWAPAEIAHFPYDWGPQSRRTFSFDGAYDGETFRLAGERGPRACTIELSRAASPVENREGACETIPCRSSCCTASPHEEHRSAGFERQLRAADQFFRRPTRTIYGLRRRSPGRRRVVQPATMMLSEGPAIEAP
jgi:hypothetical protein